MDEVGALGNLDGVGGLGAVPVSGHPLRLDLRRDRQALQDHGVVRTLARLDLDHDREHLRGDVVPVGLDGLGDLRVGDPE